MPHALRACSGVLRLLHGNHLAPGTSEQQCGDPAARGGRGELHGDQPRRGGRRYRPARAERTGSPSPSRPCEGSNEAPAVFEASPRERTADQRDPGRPPPGLLMDYLDTSAALKLLVEEGESAALAVWLDARGEVPLVSSMLLYTELHCAAQRRGSITPAAVNEILDRVELVDVERADFEVAGRAGAGLRSADAIHLVVAHRIEARTLVTYHMELAKAAAHSGLEIVSPGAAG